MIKNKSRAALMMILAVMLTMTASLALLTGCSSSKHKINIVSGEDLQYECPKRAEPGEMVTIKTVCVCDGDLYLSVAGDKNYADFVEEAVYVFEMPDNDVDVKIWVVSNGLA